MALKPFQLQRCLAFPGYKAREDERAKGERGRKKKTEPGKQLGRKQGRTERRRSPETGDTQKNTGEKQRDQIERTKQRWGKFFFQPPHLHISSSSSISQQPQNKTKKTKEKRNQRATQRGVQFLPLFSSLQKNPKSTTNSQRAGLSIVFLVPKVAEKNEMQNGEHRRRRAERKNISRGKPP